MTSPKENGKEKMINCMMIKKWHKPCFVTLSQDELKNHIKVVARSGGCGDQNR